MNMGRWTRCVRMKSESFDRNEPTQPIVLVDEMGVPRKSSSELHVCSVVAYVHERRRRKLQAGVVEHGEGHIRPIFLESSPIRTGIVND
jgi:hypothetical protein